MSKFPFWAKICPEVFKKHTNFKFRCTVCKCQITQGLADIAEKVKPSRTPETYDLVQRRTEINS